MNPSRKLLWTEKMAVRWGDMDALGHVNNTVYFRYMEQARISWFEALGVPVVVWIDHAQEKSTPLPQHILRALA